MSKKSPELGQEQRDFTSSTGRTTVNFPKSMTKTRVTLKDCTLSRYTTGQLEEHTNIWKAQFPSLRSE